MGAAMAANLAKSGCKISAWNRTPGRPAEQLVQDAGAVICNSVADAVRDADIIFVCVGDEADAQQVILSASGVRASAKPGSLIVDMGTSGPVAARQLAGALQDYNLRFVDAPVSGGDVGARQATLTIMVGADKADFEECKPYFQCMGQKIFHCGPVGSGQGIKLCNQILCAVNMVAVCEAMQLADSLDLSRQTMIEVCSTGAGGSWALANLGPKIAASDYAPAFMLKHMLKDLRLVADVVNLEEQLPGTQLAKTQFEQARDLGGQKGAEQGTQAMFRAYGRQLRDTNP